MVSIVICAVKLNEYFPECISSCIAQTYEDTEILLITEENTSDEKMCRDMAQKDSRIRVVAKEKHNVGKGRNYGLLEAKGEYICFVDADDTFYNETSLERMLRSLTAEKGDVLVSNYVRKVEDEIIPVVNHGFTERDDVLSEDFRFKGFFSQAHLSFVWAKLYRKEFLEENEIIFPETTNGEDRAFNMCVYGARPEYVFSDQVTYIYRNNLDSITHSYHENFKEIWEENAIFYDRYMEKRNSKYSFDDLSAYVMMFSLIFHVRQEYEKKNSKKDILSVVEAYTTDDYVQKKMEYLVDHRVCNQILDLGYRTGTDNLSKWIVKKRNDSIIFGLEKIFDLSIDKKHSPETRN
ncbi:MAG: glycosyltransferase [Lachnospiraceae bacterium]|nr:glycosyltransferase [Lachnospiraceae bacterium]